VRLLGYFGEASAPCGNCDNCLSPPQTFGRDRAARQALSAIFRTGQRFGAAYVIDVLRGERSERTERARTRPAGGVRPGAAHGRDGVARRVFRQLVAQGLWSASTTRRTARSSSRSPAARCCAARPWWRCGERSRVRRKRRACAARPRRSIARFARVVRRAARRGASSRPARKAFPPYVVLHDRTLAAIAQSAARDDRRARAHRRHRRREAATGTARRSSRS
jgi:ATP-dependent DNA helicase RecQ